MFDVFYSGVKPNAVANEQLVDSLEQAKELSRTRYFWWINYLTDYTGFDFLWEPVPWQAEHTHIWPSQHQDNGGTQLIPKQASTAVNYDHPQLLRTRSVPVIGIDHGEGLTVACDTKTRFISDYLGTLKRVLGSVTDEYVWIVSSVCDYTDFDFTWHPSEWQQDMLHVFASDDQEFGDTFYIHVPTFKQKVEKLKLLEWYETLCFHTDIRVPRRQIPVVEHSYDTHVQAVWEHEFATPLVEFRVKNTPAETTPSINLWREQVRTVTPLNQGSSRVIVPRDAKNYLKTQLYDYPAIDKSNLKKEPTQLLDIVFIDNGEPNADYIYQHLRWAAQRGNYIEVRRSSGVNGRVAAYRAAAELSATPWFFAVFAKLWVAEDFDWTWQPDRLQEPKHYIFHALNPVNGLVYGHQAMIAYNKKLVLENIATGLDFTLDQAHEVVPIMSGTAMYDKTPWMAWRTAFRECIKLKCNTDIESEYRLNRWLGPIPEALPNSEWSRWGAEDAVEYYNEVNGNFDALKKSYDWAWLASYALVKRNLLTNQ